MKNIVLFGSGKLTKIIVDCYKKGLLKDYKILGCYSKTKEHRDYINDLLNVKRIDSFNELLNLKPDYLIEATNPSSTKDVLEDVINKKINVILLSIGALSDEEFYKKIENKARINNVKIHIASGAISGFQVLNTMRLMGITESKLINTKNMQRLKNSPIYNEEYLDKEYVAFKGTAYDAITNLPTGINVGVATALATLGVHNTNIEIITKPNYIGDSQHIKASCGDDVKVSLDVYSSTSDIAGYSVVALLINLASPIEF